MGDKCGIYLNDLFNGCFYNWYQRLGPDCIFGAGWMQAISL
jgi:hypothetical protein